MQPLNTLAALPEIVLLVAACGLLVGDLFVPDSRRNVTYIATLVILTLVGAVCWVFLSAGVVTYAFGGMYVTDPMASLLKLVAVIAVALVIVYSQSYARDRGIWKGELFTLTLFALLGIMLMISANNLLVIYLGLELQALSLYALVALRRDHAVSSEAAMKYFVLGALASGFLLYGMSMLYGASGTLDINELADRVVTGHVASRVSLVFGTVFIVAGLAFKFGAVPFHMWVPDVYHTGDDADRLGPQAGRVCGGVPHPGRGAAATGGRLAAHAGRAGRGVVGARQPDRDCAEQSEADAGVLDHRADGFRAAGDALGRGGW
jgi:NADH-quinone oxidoreductase subunit N